LSSLPPVLSLVLSSLVAGCSSSFWPASPSLPLAWASSASFPGVAVLGLVVVSVGGGFVVAHRLVDLVRVVGRTLLHAGILAVGQLGLGLVVGRRGLFGQVGLDRLRGLGHVVDAARVLLVVHVTPSRFQFGRSETEVP
jgi:hypothetical protein